MNTARVSIFLAAIAVFGLAALGLDSLPKQAGMAFLQGAFTLGGAFVICGIFSLKMPWHGVIGAGVIALLGFSRGVLNFPNFAKFLTGESERGAGPPLEMGVTFVCLFVLLRVSRAWSLERIRKMREDI